MQKIKPNDRKSKYLNPVKKDRKSKNYKKQAKRKLKKA